MSYTVAVVGATGAVGEQMLAVLAARRFPAARVIPLASARSAGRRVRFRGEALEVGDLAAASFEGVDLALFSAGGSVSRAHAPRAAAAGAVVVDNTSAFRHHPDVPLVVPEVNGEAALAHRNVIANPNCSTIQMVVAVAPLARAAGLRRIVVSTYQAASGAGARAAAELRAQLAAVAAGDPPPAGEAFPRPLAGDCLPWIGAPLPGGDTEEERKLVTETRRILGDPGLGVAATAVRVPVPVGHAEAVNLELGRPLTAGEARAILRDAPGVTLVDDPATGRFPTQRDAAGGDAVLVGRVRVDPSLPAGLSLWVVADNLRKGAALNAVQIAEHLHQEGALRPSPAGVARLARPGDDA